MPADPKPQIYVSVDIETDGPAPGPNSLLSLGAAAFAWRPGDHQLLATFTANLTPLSEASPDPQTTAWWESQPAHVRQAATSGARDPSVVMHEFERWVAGLGPRPVFMGYPAGFDFTFVYTYLHRFVGHSPFSHSALDLKTLGASLLGLPYRKVGKRRLARRWPVEGRHTHVALDDAIEQGWLGMQMLDADHARGPV